MPTIEQMQKEIEDMRAKLDAGADKWVGKALASGWTWLILAVACLTVLTLGVSMGKAACGV